MVFITKWHPSLPSCTLSCKHNLFSYTDPSCVSNSVPLKLGAMSLIITENLPYFYFRMPCRVALRASAW